MYLSPNAQWDEQFREMVLRDCPSPLSQIRTNATPWMRPIMHRRFQGSQLCAGNTQGSTQCKRPSAGLVTYTMNLSVLQTQACQETLALHRPTCTTTATTKLYSSCCLTELGNQSALSIPLHMLPKKKQIKTKQNKGLH